MATKPQNFDDINKMALITSEEASIALRSVGVVNFLDEDAGEDTELTATEMPTKKRRGRPPKNPEGKVSKRKVPQKTVSINSQSNQEESEEDETENTSEQNMFGIRIKESEAESPSVRKNPRPLQIRSSSQSKAKNTLLTIDNEIKTRDKTKNQQFTSSELKAMEAADKMLEQLLSVLKSENYTITESETEAVLSYLQKNNDTDINYITMFLDGLRIGFEKGGFRKEGELTSIADSMSKIHKEQKEFITHQGHFVQEMKQVLFQMKNVVGSDKGVKNFELLPTTVAAKDSIGSSSKIATINTPELGLTRDVSLSAITVPIQQQVIAPKIAPKSIIPKAGSLSTKEKEEKLIGYLKSLKMGDNHLLALGSREAVGEITLKICEERSDSFWEDLKTGSLLPSEARRSIIKELKMAVESIVGSTSGK